MKNHCRPKANHETALVFVMGSGSDLMSYTALYRKFRPATFQEVKGQDPIVTTLKNQIMMDRIGHAYLFCGTRGTGKTSVAKIFARAVNCEHPVDGNPCNECRTCRAIAAGSSMNVIEIDAAPTTAWTISARSATRSSILRPKESTGFISSTRCTCCPRGPSTPS